MSVRSWIHYLLVRTDKSTQKEHLLLALAIKSIILEQFPSLTTILGGNNELLQQETENIIIPAQG